MISFRDGEHKGLLVTLLDIFILALFIFFVKGYYSFTPITARKIDDVMYRLMATDKGTFLNFNLKVKNLSSSPKVLLSESGRFFEMEISKNNERTWTWSKDKFFPRRDAKIILVPQKNREFNFRWDKIDDWGKDVGPGEYLVKCSLLFLANHPEITMTLKIKEPVN